jgi:hypothetical protein
MEMGRTRIVIVAVVAALVLTTLADAALSENYQYKRTAQDDAKAGAMLFQRSDLPRALKSLKGGRIKPDETPSTSKDECGYVPKQSDLAVTGDAESRFHDDSGVLEIHTQVSLFKSAAMASLDWNRQMPTTTTACLREILSKQRNPGESLVSMTRLHALHCGYQNASFVIELTYNYPGKPRLHFVFVVTTFQLGRTEATVGTILRELDATAIASALRIQAGVLNAVQPRLTST